LAVTVPVLSVREWSLPGSAGQPSGADRRSVVDLANAGDLAALDGEVLGDPQRPDGPGLQVL